MQHALQQQQILRGIYQFILDKLFTLLKRQKKSFDVQLVTKKFHILYFML